MPIYRKIAATIVAFLLCLQLFHTDPAQADEVVQFEDPVLEKAVRDELDLPDGVVTKAHMASLQRLWLPFHGKVQSLQGLEHAVNLDALNTNYNEIKDLTPLADLPNLTKLYVRSNQISDLSTLSTLPSLRTVTLSENYIDVHAEHNQTVIADLAQRQVEVEGLDRQRAIVWTELFDDTYEYKPDQYAFGNGIYISRDQYLSTDGVKWTKPVQDDKERFFRSVAFGKGRFVGVGTGSNRGVPVWTSEDGRNWSEKTVLPLAANAVDIVYTGKRFVLVSSASNSYTRYEDLVATSEDGLTWTVRPNQLEPGASMIAWGNGVLIAITYESVYKSADGIAWKKMPIPTKSKLNELLYADGKFIIAAENALLSSTDGTKWTATSTPKQDWRDLVHVKDRFFVSTLKERGKRDFMTSGDGKTWSALNVDETGLDIAEIRYEDDRYVAQTREGHYESKDGVHWKQTKKIERMPDALNGSAAGNDVLVWVGGGASHWGFVRMDSKGEITFYREEADGERALLDVIWTGKQFVAVGVRGLVMTSEDGLDWTKREAPTDERLNKIIQAKDTFYVVGSNGLIMRSKDLRTWQSMETDVSTHLYGIAWNGETLVAVGFQSFGTVVLRSDNGTDWEWIAVRNRNAASQFDFNMSDVAWGNGNFVITARQNYHLNYPYTVFVSADGSNWTMAELAYTPTSIRNSTTSLYSVQFTGDQFVALGNNGSVYTSGDGMDWMREELPKDTSLNFATYFNGKLYAVGTLSKIYVGDFVGH